MKKLFLDVTCVTPEISSTPDHLFISLDNQNLATITTLASKVKELKSFGTQSITAVFDRAGVFFSTSAIEFVEDTTGTAFHNLDEQFFAANDKFVHQMETLFVVVYENSFKFFATPKHETEAAKCYSDSVNLDELDNLDTLSSLSW